jgi:hypothetical protein
MDNDSKLSKIAISINGSLSNFYGTSPKTNMRWFEAPLEAQPVEWRGIWMTPRNGGGFWTKADIARAMDSVANNNVNLVYFNVWSRGWRPSRTPGKFSCCVDVFPCYFDGLLLLFVSLPNKLEPPYACLLMGKRLNSVSQFIAEPNEYRVLRLVRDSDAVTVLCSELKNDGVVLGAVGSVLCDLFTPAHDTKSNASTQ